MEKIYEGVLPPDEIDESGLMTLTAEHYSLCADTNFFEISRNILEAMEQLYEWALGLPEIRC